MDMDVAQVFPGGAFGVVLVGLVLPFVEESPPLRSHGGEGGQGWGGGGGRHYVGIS